MKRAEGRKTKWGEVGAAWKNDAKGNVSIRLNPGVVLRWDDELTLLLVKPRVQEVGSIIEFEDPQLQDEG